MATSFLLMVTMVVCTVNPLQTTHNNISTGNCHSVQLYTKDSTCVNAMTKIVEVYFPDFKANNKSFSTLSFSYKPTKRLHTSYIHKRIFTSCKVFGRDFNKLDQTIKFID